MGPYLRLLPLLTLALAACIRPLPAADSVVPTPPVLPEPHEPPTEIAVRALFVGYSGATGVASDVTRTKEEARERAQLLANTARGTGESFAMLIASYSDQPPLSDPGGPGAQVTPDSPLLPQAALEAAFRLDVNGITPPVETEQGYIIVMRTPDLGGGPLRVGARHILIQHRDSQRASSDVSRSRDEAHSLATQVANMAQADDADFKALAAKFSEEPGAERSHGDLGLFSRGQMVPAFEQAAFALEVGEVSEVVESPFGFHVIQRYK